TLLATLLRAPAVTGTFTMPLQDRALGVAVSPDGGSIAVLTNNDGIRFYDTRTRRQTGNVPAPSFAAYAYVHSSGDVFAGTSGDTPAYELVDPATGRTLRQFAISKLWQTRPTSQAEPVVVTPDGRYALFLWSLVFPGGRNGAAYVEQWPLDGRCPRTVKHA